MKYKYDVFLSFSGKDIDFVRPIWETLENSGLNVFFSEETLKKSLGLNFDDEIEDALNRSKDFLLICSPNSMQSEWVDDEYKAFYHVIHKKSKKERRFIILEGRGFDISLVPLFLRRLQRAKSVSEIINILNYEDVQPNDQEMMTPGKKLHEDENERKNTLWQIMERRMVQIQGVKVLLKDEKSGIQFTAGVSSFLMDKFPVTQDLYEEIMGKEKIMSHFKGGGRPVEKVMWFDAVEFCNRLSDKTGLKPVYTIDGEKVTADWDAKGFRLPTEAEWRYACRAGTTGERYGEIYQIAWYEENSNKTTHEVGNKEPNQWGLYDMLGNVWEWCWDWRGDYPKGDKKDWRGPESGSHRVFPGRRIASGGAWNSTAEKCTCDYRNHGYPDASVAWQGFRLARSM